MQTKSAMAMALCVAMGMASVSARAEGCLKGAAVGGVAGHLVGSGHAVLGAAAGCVTGRHLANKKAKEEAAAKAKAAAPAPAAPVAPVAPAPAPAAVK